MFAKLAGWRFGPLQMALAAGAGGASLLLLASEHYRYAPLPPLALLLLLTLTHWSRGAYYVFVFLIPFEFLSRLSETSRVFSFGKVIGAWLTLVVLFTLLLERGRAAALRSRLWLPILLFCLVNVLATLASPYLATALDNLRKLAVAVTVFALTLFFVDRRGARRTLPEVLMWSTIINYGFFLVVYLFDLPLTIAGEPLFATRASEPSYNIQGATSSLFVFLLPLLVHRVFFSAAPVTKGVYAALTLTAVSGMVFFGSRAVAVTFVVVTAMLFVQYLRFIKPKMVGFFLAFLCAAAALTLTLVPSHYWTRMGAVVETQTDPSISRRVSYLDVGWEAFKERPFLGAGPGTFPDIYSGTLQAASFAETVEDLRRKAHNTYLDVLVGTGLLGLAAFLAILATAFANYRRAIGVLREQGRHEEELLASAYLTMFVAHVVFILFATAIYEKLVWILAAMSQVSLLCAAGRGTEGAPRAPAPLP